MAKEDRRQFDEDHDAIIRTDANVKTLMGLVPVVRDLEKRLGHVEGKLKNGGLSILAAFTNPKFIGAIAALVTGIIAATAGAIMLVTGA